MRPNYTRLSLSQPEKHGEVAANHAAADKITKIQSFNKYTCGLFYPVAIETA